MSWQAYGQVPPLLWWLLAEWSSAKTVANNYSASQKPGVVAMTAEKLYIIFPSVPPSSTSSGLQAKSKVILVLMDESLGRSLVLLLGVLV